MHDPDRPRFFGIIVQMYCDDHNPPHLHAEFQGSKEVNKIEPLV